MVDLFGADKGNISLPPRLQSPEVLDGHTDNLNPVMILNMQKALYQVRITDIVQRIQRLESRNTEIEDLCSAEKLLYSQTDIETADQITQLNRQIFGEMERINDYRNRMKAVLKWMEEEKREHLDKVEAANNKYAETRLAITSEIKVLNAKINMLEEYKVAKSDLRNKLIAGDNLIAQRDEEAKHHCERIERKFKIGREKLKKEMYTRLQGLAGTFQMEVAGYMAKPIHRLMRENIFVKNELVDIVTESFPKKEMMKHTKKADDQIILETSTIKSKMIEHLIRSKIQGYLLTVVKEQHKRANDCLENLKQLEIKNKMKSIECTYSSAKVQADKDLQYISRLETDLHKQQTQLGFANYLKERSKIELQRCTDVYCDAKYAVDCALNMTNTGKDPLKIGNDQLMPYLLSILSKGDTERWKNRTPSLATITFPSDAYKIGDLGFDVSNIELHHSRKPTLEKQLSKSSTMRNLLELGTRISEIHVTKSPIKPWQIDTISLTEDSTDSEDEKAKIPGESSLSLDIDNKEPGQKDVQSEIIREEEQEADVEDKDENENPERVEKLEVEEKVAINEAAKREVTDAEVQVTKKSEKYRSAMIVAENEEQSSKENGM